MFLGLCQVDVGVGEGQVLQDQPGSVGAALGLLSCFMSTKAFAISAVSVEMSLPPATSAHIVASDPPCPLFLDAVGEITLIPGGLGVARDLAWLLLASPSWLLGTIQGINNAGGSKVSSRAHAQEALGDSDGAQACCLACVPLGSAPGR